MKNLKYAYGTLTFIVLGFLFGQFLKKGTIDLQIGGALIVLLVLPAVLDLKFVKK